MFIPYWSRANGFTFRNMYNFFKFSIIQLNNLSIFEACMYYFLEKKSWWTVPLKWNVRIPCQVIILMSIMAREQNMNTMLISKQLNKVQKYCAVSSSKKLRSRLIDRRRLCLWRLPLHGRVILADKRAVLGELARSQTCIIVETHLVVTAYLSYRTT